MFSDTCTILTKLLAFYKINITQKNNLKNNNNVVYIYVS